MKKKRLLMVLFLVSMSISAQIKGVVKDSITGKPISYVSIWVENENNGTTGNMGDPLGADGNGDSAGAQRVE